jgi:hypothetical protein
MLHAQPASSPTAGRFGPSSALVVPPLPAPVDGAHACVQALELAVPVVHRQVA